MLGLGIPEVGAGTSLSAKRAAFALRTGIAVRFNAEAAAEARGGAKDVAGVVVESVGAGDEAAEREVVSDCARDVE